MDRSTGPSGLDDTWNAPDDRDPTTERTDLPHAGMSIAETAHIELGYTTPHISRDDIDDCEATDVTQAVMIDSPGHSPVFVDLTGRRRRRLRRLAVGVGALCLVYTGMVGVSLAGGPVGPQALLPFPEFVENALPGIVKPPAEPSPSPSQRSAQPDRRTPPGRVLPRPANGGDPRPPSTPRARASAGLGAAPTPGPSATSSPRPLESAAVPTTGPTVRPEITLTPSGSASASPTGTPATDGGTGGRDSGGSGGGGGSQPTPAESTGTPARPEPTDTPGDRPTGDTGGGDTSGTGGASGSTGDTGGTGGGEEDLQHETDTATDAHTTE